MTTRLSSLIDDIEACFDSLSLTTSGPDELRQKLAALRKAVALPADTAVAEIVERLRDDKAHFRGRGTYNPPMNLLHDAATALEAEHAARVKAEGALTAADDLISFWRDYREMPSDQFHEKYRMDTATSSLRMTELALRYREARALLQGEPS